MDKLFHPVHLGLKVLMHLLLNFGHGLVNRSPFLLLRFDLSIAEFHVFSNGGKTALLLMRLTAQFFKC